MMPFLQVISGDEVLSAYASASGELDPVWNVVSWCVTTSP